MDLILFVMGIILLIVGLINILLRWCCDDAQMISWSMFIGGIIFTIIGYVISPINEINLVFG